MTAGPLGTPSPRESAAATCRRVILPIYRRFSSLSLATILAMALAVAAVAGCGDAPRVQKGTGEKLEQFSAVYRAATEKLRRPPANAEELKPFLSPGQSLESLLNSPNDNQPHVVIWGADVRAGMELKPLVIAYEKDGSGGNRFVMTAMGVFLMGPEDFKEANFPSGHKPGS
ncbi:MAG: hypothetical protein RLY70_3680 [Planctomycetota bacterium]|jgi:hypothetical protein